MKIARSSKLHFYRWLTQHKQDQIKSLLEEYSRIVNWFIDKYENEIPISKKFDLLLAKHIQSCIKDTGTWFTARLVKNAFAEGYGMVQSAKSNACEKKPYVTPIHYGRKAILSETIATQFDITNTKDFDFNITLSCIGSKQKISIPLKRNKQFNKWNMLGKRAKSVVLTNKYIQITFEIETGTKKEADGNYLGVDIGMNKLVATSNNKFIGENIRTKLDELKLKKQCSKAYYKKKEEIKEYINYSLKQIDWSSISLLVCEKLKGVKHKMKFKRRLNRNIRRVISNWNYRFVLDRLQALCEENRVSFRSVNPFYTSQECSVCGHRDKRNRLSQESFKCLTCGHSENADINASKVILNRFLTGLYGACFQRSKLVKILQV